MTHTLGSHHQPQLLPARDTQELLGLDSPTAVAVEVLLAWNTILPHWVLDGFDAGTIGFASGT